MTPTPDESRSRRSDDPDALPAPRAGRRSSADSTTSDEISVLLSSSLETEPDPMLGGSSSWDLVNSAARSESGTVQPRESGGGLDVGVDLTAPVDPTPRADLAGPRDSSPDWSRVILRSYASAVTLGLAWLIWTGKASPPPRPVTVRDAVPPRQRPMESPPSVAATSDSPMVRPLSLGKSVLAGELEATPLMVLRKSARVVRDLSDVTLVREHRNCLALTIRIRNHSQTATLTPIDALDLTDGDAFAIDAGAGPRIAMFAVDPASDWSVEDQVLPTIPPGGVADVVILSEPIGDRRLAPAMVWRLRLITDPERSSCVVLGVAFGPNDIP